MPFEEVDYNPFAPKQSQPIEESTPWSDVGKEAIANIPSSAMDFAGNIYDAIRHPVETGKAIGKTAMGVAEKAIPGEQAEEKYADAMGKFIVDRYGSKEGLKKTIANDPIGALADLATVFTMAGGAVTATGKLGKLGAVAKAGEKISQIGSAVEPTTMLAKGAVMGLKGIPNSVPERIYERVAKMSTTMKPKDRIAAVKTALEEGIMPTPKGMDVLWDRIKEIERKTDAVIDVAPDSTIETGDIVRSLDRVREDFANDPFANKFLKEIDKLELEFTDKGATITAKQAQKIKKRAYKTIRKAYDKELTSVGEDARIAVANGILEEMTMLFPELKTLGPKEGAFLNLQKGIKNSVGRIGNHDMLSLSTLIAGGGVGAASSSPLAGIGTAVVYQIIKNPRNQARLAIALRKAKKAKLSEAGRGATVPSLATAQAGRSNE